MFFTKVDSIGCNREKFRKLNTNILYLRQFRDALPQKDLLIT